MARRRIQHRMVFIERFMDEIDEAIAQLSPECCVGYALVQHELSCMEPPKLLRPDHYCGSLENYRVNTFRLPGCAEWRLVESRLAQPSTSVIHGPIRWVAKADMAAMTLARRHLTAG